jgi:predicted RNA-binding Zn-ribbon protein involved in translation (DUF1610 family)
MSLRRDVPWGPVAVCDLCSREGGIIEFVTEHLNAQGYPTHLCKLCQPKAIWCAEHRAFHYRHAQHERICLRCGKDFIGEAGYVYPCPSCAWEASRLKHQIEASK